MEKIELKLQIYGSPVLWKKCRPVKNIDFRIRQILDDMAEMMKKNKGIGLAATQAGLDLSLVVIELPEKSYRMINPKIVKRKGKIKFDEGCLSFPGLMLTVPRSEEVWVNFYDEQGKEQNIKAEGVLAVVFQHEIDHINGVLFIDRIPWWQRLSKLSKLKKIKQLHKEQKSG